VVAIFQSNELGKRPPRQPSQLVVSLSRVLGGKRQVFTFHSEPNGSGLLGKTKFVKNWREWPQLSEPFHSRRLASISRKNKQFEES